VVQGAPNQYGQAQTYLDYQTRQNAVIDTRTYQAGIEDIRTVTPSGVKDQYVPVTIQTDQYQAGQIVTDNLYSMGTQPAASYSYPQGATYSAPTYSTPQTYVMPQQGSFVAEPSAYSTPAQYSASAYASPAQYSTSYAMPQQSYTVPQQGSFVAEPYTAPVQQYSTGTSYTTPTTYSAPTSYIPQQSSFVGEPYSMPTQQSYSPYSQQSFMQQSPMMPSMGGPYQFYPEGQPGQAKPSTQTTKQPTHPGAPGATGTTPHAKAAKSSKPAKKAGKKRCPMCGC